MNLADLLFPKRCVGCGRWGKYLCVSCTGKLVKHEPQVCPVCERAAIDGATHLGCMSKNSLDGLVVMWKYREPVKGLIKQIKYKFVSDMVSEVVKLMGENEWRFPSPTVLVPIPLHQRRLKWRGFNQAEELGRKMAEKYKWRFEPDLLMRTRSNAPQVGLAMKERRENIKGVFGVNMERAKGILDVVLFDDVWTTGATMKEAAKVLKQAGMERVWGMVLAR